MNCIKETTNNTEVVTNYICKVAVTTDPVKLASSIQLSLLSGKNVEILCMGKDAAYTACKAICLTSAFTYQNGLNIVWKPQYKTSIGDQDGQLRSVMSFLVCLV